jgi:putative addiction module component (TIGR02574 family)
VVFETVLQEALKLSPSQRAELVEHLIDSLEHEVDLSAEELALLDDALAEADRAVERRELIPGDEVVALMRETS